MTHPSRRRTLIFAGGCAIYEGAELAIARQAGTDDEDVLAVYRCQRHDTPAIRIRNPKSDDLVCLEEAEGERVAEAIYTALGQAIHNRIQDAVAGLLRGGALPSPRNGDRP